MRPGIHALTDEYTLALREFLSGGGEAALLSAYELGRRGLAEGFGVLEIAALHQEALVRALLLTLAPEEGKRLAKRASEFFVECVAPFEMTRRGVQEANSVLRGLNVELEQRIKATEEQLDERARTERLKDEFISIVSHELRTPLTSIHASLGLLRGGSHSDPKQSQQLLDVAYRSSRRLVRLVNDILDLQKIESGTQPLELEWLDLGALLEQAVQANQAYAAELGVRLALEGAPPQVTLWADPDRMMQVMANLLSNAAKFSPKGATVVVRTRATNGRVRVEVIDRGPGIPQPFQDHVFERFAQADATTTRAKGGTGLGLSITKAIVERLGGRIGFETKLGSGTIFHFDLPIGRGPEPLSEARSFPEKAGPVP